MVSLSAEQRSLVRRAGALKPRLVDFALSPPFARRLREALRAEAELDPGGDPELQLVAAVEHLLFEAGPDDGRGVLDRFAATVSDPVDTALLEGFRRDVVGVFEVRDQGEDVLGLHSLVNDLDYIVASTVPGAADGLAPGRFLAGRILPVGDVWMLSGSHPTYGPAAREAMVDAVLDLLVRAPHLAFENPVLLEQAVGEAARMHERFVELFGADLVVLEAAALGLAYADLLAPDPTEDVNGIRQQALDSVAGLGLDPSAQVGVVSHPVAGDTFLVDADQVLAALAGAPRPQRTDDLVRSYLRDDTIPSWAFERLVAEVSPDRVDVCLAQTLGLPDFSWQRDGADLLAARDPGYGQPLRPTVVVVPPFVQEVRADLG